MKNFLRRLDKMQFLILILILLCAINFYISGFQGLIAAVIGWLLGVLIYNWREYKPRIKNFLRRRTRFQIKLIVFIPVALACFCYGGLKYLLALTIGWCLGELIWNRSLK